MLKLVKGIAWKIYCWCNKQLLKRRFTDPEIVGLNTTFRGTSTIKKKITSLAPLDDELLIYELMKRNLPHEGPLKTEWFTRTKEAIMEIGPDHTARLVMTESAYETLERMMS